MLQATRTIVSLNVDPTRYEWCLPKNMFKRGSTRDKTITSSLVFLNLTVLLQ